MHFKHGILPKPSQGPHHATTARAFPLPSWHGRTQRYCIWPSRDSSTHSQRFAVIYRAKARAATLDSRQARPTVGTRVRLRCRSCASAYSLKIDTTAFAFSWLNTTALSNLRVINSPPYLRSMIAPRRPLTVRANGQRSTPRSSFSLLVARCSQLAECPRIGRHACPRRRVVFVP